MIPIASSEIATHDRGDPEPVLAQADEVTPDPLRRLALCAHQLRVVEPLEAGEQAEDRTRCGDGRQQRDQRSDQEHQGEALDACRRDQEEHHGGDRGDDVRVDDGREALAVAGGDRGPDVLPGAVLLLHALEDDDVRVGGHPQRQDHPGEARQGQSDVEDEDRGVEEGGVDEEADHGDDAEHAVEDEQEERDGEESGDRRLPRLGERVLAQRGGDRGGLERLESDGQGTALEDEREVLRLFERADAGDLSAIRAADPVRVLLEVDRRPRLDLAVEHDREVLERVGRIALAAGDVVAGAATVGLAVGDLAELVAALVGELHRHDRLARRGVEVLAGAGQLEVGAGHLGDDLARVGVVRVVVEEVVVVLLRVLDADPGADDLADAAGDDDGARRHTEDLPVLRELALLDALLCDDLALQESVAIVDRAGDQLLVLVEQVPGRLGVLLDERLLSRKELVERLLRGGEAAGVRRRRKVGLEVEELELRRLAEDADHAVGVLDARKVDHDLVVALLADLGLGNAEPVDAVAQDLDRAVEVGLLQRPVRRRHRLQRHLEPALQIEPERRLVVERRTGNGE